MVEVKTVLLPAMDKVIHVTAWPPLQQATLYGKIPLLDALVIAYIDYAKSHKSFPKIQQLSLPFSQIKVTYITPLVLLAFFV